MQVRELMTRDVQVCGPRDDLNRAAQIMWDHDCGVVPVVDSERRPIGMVTDRDVCMAAYTQGKPLSAIRAEEVMSRELQTCGPDTPVGDAEAAMRERRVRRLPVVDPAGKLVGILSLNDVARRAVQERGKRRGTPALDEVSETLAAVCRPWSEVVGEGARGVERSKQGAAVLVPRGSR